MVSKSSAGSHFYDEQRARFALLMRFCDDEPNGLNNRADCWRIVGRPQVELSGSQEARGQCAHWRPSGADREWPTKAARVYEQRAHAEEPND